MSRGAICYSWIMQRFSQNPDQPLKIASTPNPAPRRGAPLEPFLRRTVILANGDFPSAPWALDALSSARHVICCDGAAAPFIRRFRRDPDAVVGDLDSLPPALRRRLGARAVRVSEQDDNDLAKAFDFCVSRRLGNDIVILGATGRREDHTLANISWLAEFATRARRVALLTDTGVFTAITAPGGAVATRPGMQLSFFGFDQNQTLTADGVLYPVRDLRLRRWFTASLNEATGRRVRLSFAGAPVVVFREFPRQRR